MNCEFNYCIYNQNFLCTLEKIHINSLGMCEECIIISIPENVLQELKGECLKGGENICDMYK